MMKSHERSKALSAYREHAARFEAIAARRSRNSGSSEEPRLTLVALDEPRATRTARSLSPRELEVLSLVAAGLSNGEIGGRLFIAEETVKSHVQKILSNLGARNRAHAVALAFRTGLIDPDAAGASMQEWD
jgi:DNA-binding NarL/FixJ family response regulator